MEKDTEQRRAEMREQLADDAGKGDDEQDREGHAPLPGLVGNRVKDASEPDDAA